MKITPSLGLILFFALTESSAQLPEECKPPAAVEQAIRDNPSAKTYMEAGSRFVDQGNLKCAVASLEEAVRLAKAAHDDADPQLISTLGDLGVLRANKGDTEGAERLLRLAIEYDPNYEQGHVNLGLILAKQQRFTEAEAEVDKALKLAPEDAAALEAAGRVKARLGKSVEGVALLRKAVALKPQSATAHLELGMVLADNYDLEGALTENSEAVRLAPGSAFAHLDRGRVLFDLGRKEEAQPDLESASRLAPEMPEPYFFLALIAKQDGHYKHAVTLLQTVVKLEPRNAAAWYLLGQSFEQTSQTKAAIAAWKQAVAIEPDYSQALWNLARALKPDDPDEAARFMARYSELQKKRLVVDQASTLGNDALAAGKTHDWPEAIRQFQKAIEVCGDCTIKADLHKKLGITECQMGDIENGEKELRLAQTLKPADPDIERALGRIAAVRAKRATSRPDSEKPH
jgi:tetratricopeptide (TPR) repeat protein